MSGKQSISHDIGFACGNYHGTARMRALAVDVGGTHVACGAVDDQELVQVCSIDTDSRGHLSTLLPTIAQTLKYLRKQHAGNFAGIGFGFCGLVDSAGGRVISTNHKYSDATEIDLRSWAREEFELPLKLENDARLALLGERHSGAAQNTDDVVMMSLGTGIGTAALMGGHLVRGKHFQAGCLGGHFTIVAEGRVCSCGTYALPNVCKTWPGFKESALAREPRIDFVTLFRWADSGDRVAGQIRTRCIRLWAACALSLIHAYDPELLVLGGGVMRSSYPILPKIQEHIDSYAWTPWGKVRVDAAQLGNNAALLGAVPLLADPR